MKAKLEARMTNDESNSNDQMTEVGRLTFRAFEHSDIDSNFVIRISSFPRRTRRGLSIVELLISLAISASLLTAVAAAFSASADAIDINDQCARATHAARVSVSQIMTEARRCQAGVVGSGTLELTLSTGEIRTYSFDSANRRLDVTLNSLVPPETHPMARDVSNVQFLTDGKTISMNITVTVGSNAVVLNGSAMPRRAVTYQ